MQTPVRQKHNQRGRISGIAMIVSCAAAILLAGGQSSTGGTGGNPATATVLVRPGQADNDRAGEPDDVATLLAWHVEARILAHYANQITLAEPSRALAEAGRKSVVPVAAVARNPKAR